MYIEIFFYGNVDLRFMMDVDMDIGWLVVWLVDACMRACVHAYVYYCFLIFSLIFYQHILPRLFVKIHSFLIMNLYY